MSLSIGSRSRAPPCVFFIRTSRSFGFQLALVPSEARDRVASPQFMREQCSDFDRALIGIVGTHRGIDLPWRIPPQSRRKRRRLRRASLDRNNARLKLATSTL